MLLQLSSLDPFAATAGPDVALALLDARDALAVLGVSIAEADRLLRGPDDAAARILEKQAGALLAAARSANLAIINESTVTNDQRSVLLSKILTDFGWDSGRIANVLSATHLGLNWGDYVAPLDVLPAGVNLPTSITYDKELQQLTASISVRPTALRADIAPLLTSTTDDLNAALVSLDAQAQSREAELALLQTLLREKTPHTFETNWSIPASVPLVIPTEWKGRFYYERALGKLRFVGWMSPADQAALLALGPSLNVSTSTPTFPAAINDLFDKSKSSAYTSDPGNTLVVRQGTAGLADRDPAARHAWIAGSMRFDSRPAAARLATRRSENEARRRARRRAEAARPKPPMRCFRCLITVASSGLRRSPRRAASTGSPRTRACSPATRSRRPRARHFRKRSTRRRSFSCSRSSSQSSSSTLPRCHGCAETGVGSISSRYRRRESETSRADLWTSLVALSKLIALKKNPKARFRGSGECIAGILAHCDRLRPARRSARQHRGEPS